MKLELQALQILKRTDIRQGYIVLDFGCGSGTLIHNNNNLEEGQILNFKKLAKE